jgi:hypothetical protein
MIGFLPVHVAAVSANVHALRALLELYPSPSEVAEDVKDVGNRDGITPIEGLREVMRSSRQFSETLLGKWDGYNEDELRCEYLLAKAGGGSVQETEEEYVKKRKWGCTCGTCTNGWLSPRMRFRLSGM